MSKSRTWIGPSEAQGNAEALGRREAPYTAASAGSFCAQWDYRQRDPRDLGDAVRTIRRAYADEVPPKLHEGPDSIGEDGTPKMTARATGYIFGSASASDRSDPDQLVSFYHSPFRATLDRLEHGSETERFMAAVVRHVAIGGRGPRDAVIAEGVPAKAARFVVEPVLRSFLRQLTDMRLHTPRETDTPLSEGAAVA